MTSPLVDSFLFLAAPFCLTALLILVHSYLGLHILERDIIFVDISLSQVAALGAAVTSVAFHSHESLSLGISLGFCLVVSILLSIFRKIEKTVSQETLVGITYALASGLLVLVLDQSPHGAEHLKNSLVGNILFITWTEVFWVAAIYSFVGLTHYFLRNLFWSVSRGETSSVLADILFYFLFSIVITFSTHHAGVLVVFSALVIPAALARKQGGSLFKRIFTAWTFGLFASLIAFAISYYSDWPLGAGLVVTFSLLFFLIIALKARIARVDLNNLGSAANRN